MSKRAKKPSTASVSVPAAKPSSAPSAEAKNKKAVAGSKQSRVITMLQSPDGATIVAMMKATGWQQHSVRGFLAGVVRKKLKMNLDSKKIDGSRFYRIKGADGIWSVGRRHGPLGYDTKDRKISVNEPEADLVRTIFQRYLKLGSINLLV